MYSDDETLEKSMSLEDKKLLDEILADTNEQVDSTEDNRNAAGISNDTPVESKRPEPIKFEKIIAANEDSFLNDKLIYGIILLAGLNAIIAVLLSS